MEEIFDKFNSLIQEMADAVANANTPEEAVKIQAEYDSKVDKAEKQLEIELEEEIQRQEEALLKEQEEVQKQIEEENNRKEPLEGEEEEEDTSDIEKEIEFLKENTVDVDYISKRYNKTNSNKNGFSTTEIYKYLGGEGNPVEKEMSEYIFEKIK